MNGNGVVLFYCARSSRHLSSAIYETKKLKRYSDEIIYSEFKSRQCLTHVQVKQNLVYKIIVRKKYIKLMLKYDTITECFDS